MKIAIIHLSDIHFASSNDLVFSRFDKITAAVKSFSSEIEAYFIAVSGDIANWGLETEYEIAKIFFTNLIESLKTSTTGEKPVFIVFCPGNHDCDFSDKELNEVRQVVLETLPSKLLSLTSKSGLIKQCLAVQQNFFNFVSSLPNSKPVAKSDQLSYDLDFEVLNHIIRFRCYNTAWVSQIHEKQGELLFPTQLIKEINERESKQPGLIVSLFHHPYNWLNETNAHSFKGVMERTSDIILTGHEHVEAAYLKENLTGEVVRYIAGGVLQERNSTLSKFNIILVDINKELHKISNYKWNDTFYKTILSTEEWLPFQRNSALTSNQFINNPEFSERLHNTGAVFIHPHKNSKMTLKDIFVYPELKQWNKRLKNNKQTIKGEAILEKLLKEKFAVIYGDEYSGKTALAKILYSEFLGKNLTPILLRHDHNLRGYDDDSLKICLNKAIKEQYREELQEPFHQLPAEKKVLIIDDFHKFNLNKDYQHSLLETAQKSFGTIIVFANEVFQLQSLLKHSELSKSLLAFSTFNILELGRKLRGDIIRKWLKLGREVELTSTDLSREEIELEKVLIDTIGKNAIPSYPFWILSILQTWNTAQSGNGNFGAFGYIYDELITKQLREAGYDPTKIDTNYTFLGRIAYFLFKQNQESFTVQDLDFINDEYYKAYEVRIDINALLKKLTDARIFRNGGETYRFTQPYIFYFFVARYIKENLSGRINLSQLRDEVMHMIKYMYYEPYSHILLILVYLTRDKEFIEEIIKNAQLIFDEYPICDLNQSVAFLNNLSSYQKKLIVNSDNTEDNRDEYRESFDDNYNDGDESIIRSQHKSHLVAYHKDLDIFGKITIAFRNLELMGQILRNFPGSLFADLKLSLAQESYSLGLRILQSLMKLAEENFEEFREFYAEVIRERKQGLAESEIGLEANALIVSLTSSAAFGIIKRISSAVGHDQLQETYKKVEQNLDGVNSVALIDLSIKLDHFKGVPHYAVGKLADDLQNNNFAYNILRDLIYHFFYLYPVDILDKQKLAGRLDISLNSPQLLMNNSKTNKPRSSRSRRKKR